MGTWEDPPENTERNKKWDTTFQQLKKNPGRWAKLYEGKDRNAHSLAGRLRKNYPGYEIKSQTLAPDEDGEKQAGVWARYNEPEELSVLDVEKAIEDATSAPRVNEDDWDQIAGNNPYGYPMVDEAKASVALDGETYAVSGGNASLDG